MNSLTDASQKADLSTTINDLCPPAAQGRGFCRNSLCLDPTQR
jgi:hypothetical protein